MKKIILSVIGSLFFSYCFSMENKKTQEKQILVFDSVALDTLLCIDYSDATFGEYDEIIDYNLERKIELTEENVRKMFLGNKDMIEIISYETHEVVNYITAEEYLEDREFYLQDIVSSNKKWTAIIIEEIDYGRTFTMSNKYIVTIDENQNLITKYRIAYYGKFGTYTCDCVELADEDENGNIIPYKDENGDIIESCGRCPWFTGKEGCIDKDFFDKEGYIN